MIPIVEVDRVETPGGTMTLARRGDQFSIRIRGVELMNSLNHVSEDELGRVSCGLVAGVAAPRVLIGGLGLGYTLRAMLDGLPARAHVEIVELVPAVVRWNREHTGALAGRPLEDPRVTVIENDVRAVIERAEPGRYHAIVLDVDNGPDELFESNQRLYRRAGLEAARRALASGGGLAVWSAFESPTFTRWLKDSGFAVETVRVKARGARHVIWLARRER